MTTCSIQYTKKQNGQQSENVHSSNGSLSVEHSGSPISAAVCGKLFPAEDGTSTPTVDYLALYTHQSLIEYLWMSVKYLYPAKAWSLGRINQFAIINYVFTMTFFGHQPSMIRVLCMTPAQLGILVQRDEQGESEGSIAELSRLRCLELDMSPSKSSVNMGAQWDLSPFDGIPPPNPVDLDVMDIPLQFVQRHQRRFKGTLKEIVVRGSDASWSPVDHLLRHVMPMHVVDFSAWNSPLPTFEQIPTAELRVLRLNLPRRLDWPGVTPAFLQSCTKLRELWMPTQNSTFFQRVAQNGESDQAHPPAPVTNTKSVVPPLKVLRLYGVHSSIVANMLAAFESCDKLTECQVVEEGVGRRAEYLQSIQWSCRLEHLTFLSLRGRFVYFLDLQSLLHCPMLSTLRLVTETDMRAAPVNHLPVLGQLKRLEELQLRGTTWRLDTEALLQIGQGLSQSLRHLDIMDSMQLSVQGLADFTYTATRLESLKLGLPYLQVKARLLASVRESVKVVISIEPYS
ncbi:hypothetical protein BGW41_005118 [Actinomortierella wolfii]|nr:hypothetical protein BGW41_005118 [Actinomortierella wolfii]